jgi:hypothetical protein
MKNKKLKIDFMIYDITKDEWTWISEIKSGEFIHNNTLIKVFTTDRGYTFYQTKWGNTTISNVSWNKCQETIEDRQDNAQHYAYMEHLKHESLGEMYNNNHNNWTGD